jgi:hypothetical protein
MGKLTPAEIDAYFATHLSYRRRILLTHYRMTRKPWRGDPGQLDACFVASLITGRLFLNVLGIGKNNKTGALVRFVAKADDVTLAELGGLLIDPATLSSEEKTLFLDFLKMADKAAAHFTTPMNHDWARTHDLILRIDRYLKINLYDHTGRTFKDEVPSIHGV